MPIYIPPELLEKTKQPKKPVREALLDTLAEARDVIGLIPWIGDAAQHAINWVAKGYGTPTLDSILRYIDENRLDVALSAAGSLGDVAKAGIPIIAATGPAARRVREILKHRLGISFPGKLRVYRFQHVDDPVFTSHPSRGLIFTGAGPNARAVERKIRRLAPVNIQNDPNYAVRVAEVAVERPLFYIYPKWLQGIDRNVKLWEEPDFVGSMTKKLDPELYRAMGTLGFAPDWPKPAQAWITRGPSLLDAMAKSFADVRKIQAEGLHPVLGEKVPYWSSLPLNRRRWLGDRISESMQNREAQRMMAPTRYGGAVDVSTIGDLITRDLVLSHYARRHGFDAIIVPEYTDTGISRFVEVALVPNTRRYPMGYSFYDYSPKTKKFIQKPAGYMIGYDPLRVIR